jgi:hypothetical protein
LYMQDYEPLQFLLARLSRDPLFIAFPSSTPAASAPYPA